MITIKDCFGKAFWAARKARKISRADLGKRLGVSPKTIQSWENGRTFVEKLELIPLIEQELGISFSELIRKSIASFNPRHSDHEVYQKHWILLPVITGKDAGACRTITVCVPDGWSNTNKERLAVISIDKYSKTAPVYEGGVVVIDLDRCIPANETPRLYAIRMNTGNIEFSYFHIKHNRLRYNTQPVFDNPKKVLIKLNDTNHKILGCVTGIIGRPR